MRIFNAEKTIELCEYDLTKGELVDDVLITIIPEVPAIEGQGHYEVVAEYPATGGKELQWVVDVEGQALIPESKEEEHIKVYMPYSHEQLAEMELTKEREKQQQALTEEQTKRDTHIATLQAELTALSQDIVQDLAGEVVPDIAERKARFIEVHNELRELLGKTDRKEKE